MSSGTVYLCVHISFACMFEYVSILSGMSKIQMYTTKKSQLQIQNPKKQTMVIQNMCPLEAL